VYKGEKKREKKKNRRSLISHDYLSAGQAAEKRSHAYCAYARELDNDKYRLVTQNTAIVIIRGREEEVSFSSIISGNFEEFFRRDSSSVRFFLSERAAVRSRVIGRNDYSLFLRK